MPTVAEVKAAVTGKAAVPAAQPAAPAAQPAAPAAQPAAPATQPPAPVEGALKPTDGPPRKYTVGLKDNPPLTVEAADRLDAIDVYKRRCGIVETIHKFSVEAAE